MRTITFEWKSAGLVVINFVFNYIQNDHRMTLMMAFDYSAWK
jgi:hypothetical protein